MGMTNLMENSTYQHILFLTRLRYINRNSSATIVFKKKKI